MLPTDPIAVVGTASLRRLTRAEYERMTDAGMFQGERLELLQGMIFRMSPQNARHAAAIERLTHLLTAALGHAARVRIQLPLAVSDDSEPEPDVAVVPIADYSRAHPQTALLVIEVADASLDRDRLKAAMYAAAGVPEYWIVDLVNDTVEVHTQPGAQGYTAVAIKHRGESIAATVEGLVVRVEDLLEG